MLPKRQLKCVCKLPHVGQSTAASSPSYTQCFQTPETAWKPSVCKGKKGPLGGFLSSHPQIGPFTWGLLPKHKQVSEMMEVADYKESFKGLWI